MSCAEGSGSGLGGAAALSSPREASGCFPGLRRAPPVCGGRGGALLWRSATWAHLFHGTLLSRRGGCKAGDARGPPGIWAEGIVPATPRALLLKEPLLEPPSGGSPHGPTLILGTRRPAPFCSLRAELCPQPLPVGPGPGVCPAQVGAARLSREPDGAPLPAHPRRCHATLF